MFFGSVKTGARKDKRVVVGSGRRRRKIIFTHHHFRQNARDRSDGRKRLKNYRQNGQRLLVEIVNSVEQFFRCRLSRSENILCQRLVRCRFGKYKNRILEFVNLMVLSC
jgi:hypothetical protein